jgi:thiol:disulfide interchange protein DsbD
VSLAVAVIAAKALGYSVGWGFQFQEPMFLVGMATLLTVMSLGLFGVFFVQVNSGNQLDKLANRKGLAGAFFTGVVATILSTPCTAPFLGSAIGFAFAAPWYAIIAIFFAVGAGLAFPYVLLCLNPAWMKILPKPGVWMEHFKEAMGFVLLGSVIWLLYVLGRQTGPDGVAGTVGFLLAASFGTWLYNKLCGFDASKLKKVTLAVVALAIAGSTMYFLTWPSVKGTNWSALASGPTVANGVTWEKFSKEAVDKHLKDGKVVFLDFTAEWCQTCKFNEATVLASDAVTDAFKNNGVATLKADWTTSDPEITQLLAKFGRAGVPLYVVMSPHRPTAPTVLPTLLTKEMVLEAIENASRP